MLRSVSSLEGSVIVATDGEIGSVEQFYFDDERWALRYIVVNTGTWLSGRQVLISPFSVTQVDTEQRKLQVNLTKSQVEGSPDIDTHQPVSRQMEAAHADYYGYPYYWGSSFLWAAEERPGLASRRSAGAMGAAAAALPASADGPTVLQATGGTPTEVSVNLEDVHLRSTQEVATYRIDANDGEIGHVEDFIIADDSWTIRYVAIDTRNWLPGKRVIVSPQWISSIDWAQGKVHLYLSREGVKQSPVYDSSLVPSRDYEEQLYGHYGRAGYWLK